MNKWPSPALVDFVAGWESLRTEAYLDAVGIPTIGYGRTSNVNMGDTCTPEQAMDWLRRTLNDTANRLSPFLVREPSQQQFDALASLAYNVGVAALGQSGLIRLFNIGDDSCADRFLLWNKAGGKVLAGLTKRREAERAIYLFGDYSGRP